MGAPSVTVMGDWDARSAQQAINIVAPVMAGQPRDDVEVELRRWLDRHGATLPEPHFSGVVEAVAAGSVIVTLHPRGDVVASGSGQLSSAQ